MCFKSLGACKTLAMNRSEISRKTFTYTVSLRQRPFLHLQQLSDTFLAKFGSFEMYSQFSKQETRLQETITWMTENVRNSSTMMEKC